MRIYLDTCVFQDLKNEINKNLLDIIIQSKGELIYCFSEAHIQDLSRDKTDNKFSDMAFMETIVDNNCFYYDKAFLVDNLTPIEYYNHFDWSSVTSATEVLTNVSEDDIFSELFKSMMSLFSAIPLNLKKLIPQNQLPDNMPSHIKNLLDVSNMGEFMSAMTNYSDKLTEEQKVFKEQLQYLHKSQLNNYLNSLGIDGYDGQQITDKERFRTSYANYYLKNTHGKGKYRYDLYLDMYNGLEFWGFVQGKTRKQKMMNMINDARHSFFGGFCDIVVSKDEDFINKTKFMYNIHEIQTQVYSVSEFSEFLEKHNKNSNKSFIDLINELYNEKTQSNILYKINEGEKHAIVRKLSNTYYGYFNAQLNHSNGCIYFTKEKHLFGTGTLIVEIVFCVNQLVKELGIDVYSRGEWINDELKKDAEKDWHGRTWVINNKLVVDLKFFDKLYIILGMAHKSEK